MNLAEERAASHARTEVERAANTLTARAGRLRRYAGTHMDLAKAALKEWPHLSDDERREIIERAGARDKEQRKVEREKIGPERTYSITKRLIRADPHAKAADIFTDLQVQGDPGIKKTSWQAMYFGPIRKELGITGRPGSRKPTSEAAADPPAAPERSPLPSREPASELPTVSEVVSELIAMGTLAAENISDRDTITITTPGGTFKAVAQGSGWWHVEFSGPVERALMGEIMADMLRPVIGDAAEDEEK